MNETALTRDHVETAVLAIARLYPKYRGVIFDALVEVDFEEHLRQRCFAAMVRLHESHTPFSFEELERELETEGVDCYGFDTIIRGLTSVAAETEDLPEYLAWLLENSVSVEP